MATQEAGMGDKEEFGQDTGTGGSMLGRQPDPASQQTGESDQRGHGAEAEELKQ